MLKDNDLNFLHSAIELARSAQQIGNLPIGAVITLDDEIIGEGKNSIWVPQYRPNRHAEIEALESVREPELWSRSRDMTLYTTLEPCLMCLGTILVYRIGRVVFGSNDPHGGARCIVDYMPKAFDDLWKFTEWIGPALPQECDELSHIVVTTAKSHQQGEWGESTPSLWDSITDPKFDPNRLKQSLDSRSKRDQQK